MIHTEFYRTREDGINLYKTYSDNNKYIIQDQTSNKYIDAINIENSGYTYTESDEIIKNEEEALFNEYSGDDITSI
jgi:hypothetical protein